MHRVHLLQGRLKIFYRELLAGSEPAKNVKTFPSNFSVLANEMRSVGDFLVGGRSPVQRNPSTNYLNMKSPGAPAVENESVAFFPQSTTPVGRPASFGNIFCRCGLFISWRCNLSPSTFVFMHLVEFSDRVDKRI